MAIEANDGGKEVVVSRKLYTGLCNMKVEAINPNKTQMEEMGLKPQQEPEYCSTSDEGVKKVRLDIYLKSVDETLNINAKVAFWLEKQEFVGQTSGKMQYINDRAQTAWAMPGELPAYDWFDSSTARPALRGEEGLYDFIKAWMNVSTQQKEDGTYPLCKLDNFDALFEGSFRELQEIVTVGLAKNNCVKVLLGVRNTDDGKQYQDVYTKMFDRSYTKDTSRWMKKLNDEYGKYNQDYQGSLALKEYNGPIEIVPDAPALGGSDDADNPF